MARHRFGILGLALAVGLALPCASHASGTLRFALNQDPDPLDPAVSGSYGDRIVTNWMCDQLLDVNDKLDYVPALATEWAWSSDGLALTLKLRDGVTFQDGEPFTSEAVRGNIQRYQHAPESLRKAELKPVIAVETPDRLTAKLILSRPYAPLLSLLANRPGTMLSPRILGKTRDEIVANPVCAGPYKFTQRMAQDRIVLDRYPGHWNNAAMGPDRVIFLSMVESTIRLVNLRSGQIDIHNAVPPTDAQAVKADPRLRLLVSPSLGFQLLTFNLNHGPDSNNPLGRDKRVRAAFEKSLDRAVINQVVFEGGFVPSNQTEAPGSRYWNPALPVPPRDIEGAKRLMREAGQTNVSFTLIIGTDSVNAQVGQVIQSMAAEAGFDVKLQASDGATMVAAARAGSFQSALSIWSGRPDPDGNASIWMSCAGFLNWGQYCNKEMDENLAKGAAEIDPAARTGFYRRVTEIMNEDRANIVLYHFTWLWGLSEKVQGARGMPDGILRPAGVRIVN